MLVIRKLYSFYALIIFTLIFVILLPAFLILILVNDKHPWLYQLNRLWAKVFFILILMPVKKSFETPIKRHQRYIFCANHFSYLDIPILGFIPVSAVFVGKSSLASIPIFGHMFRKVHVTVDRSKLKSRYQALNKSIDVLKRGLSLIIFPEGGIMTQSPPSMAKFKEGAFRAAIDQQIPIVPVTIPYNWIILPDQQNLLLQWHRAEIIFHAPIETKGLTMNDVDELRKRVFNIIDHTLKAKNNYEYRQKHVA